MKKILTLSVFALFTVLVSCSKDDDNTSGNIVGKWAFYKYTDKYGGETETELHENECPTKKDYIEFANGGVAYEIYYDENCDILESSEGTWSKSGKNITLDGITAKIVTLNSSTLKVKFTYTDEDYGQVTTTSEFKRMN